MPRRFRPTVEPVEARLTPAFAAVIDGAVLIPAAGGTGEFRIISPSDGSDLGTVQPFGPGYTGEVRAASGDVTNDGVTDLVVGAGPGGAPRVVVYDGKSGQVIADFLTFEPDFRGGVYVAAGDVNGDGFADIIVGAGEGGGPVVRVFNGRNPPGMFTQFFAFEESFRGGVRVAVGDVDGDGDADLVAGAGVGGAPRVRVFNALPAVELTSFMAYDPALRSGVFVATAGAWSSFASASLTSGTGAKVVTGPGAGGAPHVKVFSGTTGEEYFSFYRGDESSRVGVTVTGNRYGVVTATPTPTPSGPSLAGGSWSAGSVYWTLPPGSMRLLGTLTAVDAAARSVTIRVGDSEPRVLPVRATATSREGRVPVTLDSLSSGYKVSVLVSTDGIIDILDAAPPPPVSPPPSEVIDYPPPWQPA